MWSTEVLKRLSLRVFALLATLLLGLSLACGSVEPTQTPIPPAEPAQPPIPTATVPTPTPTLVSMATPVPPPANTPKYGGTLRHVTSMSWETLDPNLLIDFRGQRVIFTIYDGLVETKPGFEVGPGLARSWQLSPDGKAITFELTRGVIFHDGSDFNAEVVKWNIEHMLNPESFSKARPLLEPVIARIEILDSHRVMVHLKKPWRPLLGSLTMPETRLISPPAKEKYGEDYGRKPAGTGPFKLQEWLPDRQTVLSRFENYWEKGKPYLDGIKFQHVPDRSVQLAMLRTKETDLIDDALSSDIPLLKGNLSIKITTEDNLTWFSQFFKVRVPPYDNKALRQAISYAMDRDTLVDVYLGGLGKPAYAMGIFWYGDQNYQPYKYDPKKAKEKLVEAGYPKGVTVPLLCEGRDIEVRLCEIIQAMMADVGINVQINVVSSQDFRQLRDDRARFGWARQAYFPQIDPDSTLRTTLHSTGGRARLVGYANPEVDNLIDEAAGVYDTAKAGAMYIQAQKIAFEGAPYVGLFFRPFIVAMNVKVQNFIWFPDTVVRLRNLWLEK